MSRRIVRRPARSSVTGQCEWPGCEIVTGLVPVRGRLGKEHLHCGRHDWTVTRLLAVERAPRRRLVRRPVQLAHSARVAAGFLRDRGEWCRCEQLRGVVDGVHVRCGHPIPA